MIKINKTVRKDIEFAQQETDALLKSNSELLSKNELLEIRVQELQNELENAKQVIKEKDALTQRQGKEITSLKNIIAELETKLSKFDEGKQLTILKMNKQNDMQENLSIKAQVLEKQVHALTDALLNCEQSMEALLMEKSKISNQSFYLKS